MIVVAGVLAFRALRYYLVTTLGERSSRSAQRRVRRISRICRRILDSQDREIVSRLTATPPDQIGGRRSSDSAAQRGVFFGGRHDGGDQSGLSLFVLASSRYVLPLVGFGRAGAQGGAPHRTPS